MSRRESQYVKEIHIRVDEHLAKKLNFLLQREREQKQTTNRHEVSYSSVIRHGVDEYYKKEMN